jgi:hypothetical protein
MRKKLEMIHIFLLGKEWVNCIVCSFLDLQEEMRKRRTTKAISRFMT